MNKKDLFIKKTIKNFTNNLRTSIPILFFVFIVVWGYFFFVFYQIDLLFEIQKENFNNKIRNTPDYIPEIFFDHQNKKYRLFKNQKKFIDENIKQIKIIEKEMKELFSNKKKERAIIFCFNKNKELIYCVENENHHYYDTTKEGSSEENSVAFEEEKIIEVFKNNKDFAYFINIHNHPSKDGIHLPSVTDLKTSTTVKSNFDQEYWFSLIWAEPKELEICRLDFLYGYQCPRHIVWYANSLEKICSSETNNYIFNQKNNCIQYEVRVIFNFFDVEKNYIIYI